MVNMKTPAGLLRFLLQLIHFEIASKKIKKECSIFEETLGGIYLITFNSNYPI
jgi:hypothetical protein